MAFGNDQPTVDEVWWTKCRDALHKFGSVMTRSKYREIQRKFGCSLDVLLIALPLQTKRRSSVERRRVRARAQTLSICGASQAKRGRRRGYSPVKRRRATTAERHVRDNCIAKRRCRRRRAVPSHERSVAADLHRRGRARERRSTAARDAQGTVVAALRRSRRLRAGGAAPPTPTLASHADAMTHSSGVEKVVEVENDEDITEQRDACHVLPVREASSDASQCNRETMLEIGEHIWSTEHLHELRDPGRMGKNLPSSWDIKNDELIKSTNITITYPDITLRDLEYRTNSRIRRSRTSNRIKSGRVRSKTYKLDDIKNIDVILPPIPIQISGSFESVSLESWTVYPPEHDTNMAMFETESWYVDVESLDDVSSLHSSEESMESNLDSHDVEYTQKILPYSVPDKWCDTCRERAVPTCKIFSLTKRCRWPKWVNSILGYMGLNSSGT